MEMDPKIKRLVEDHRLFRVLEHMSIAKVDYAKNVMRYTEIPIVSVRFYLEILEKMCFLDYYTNTSIKRRDAKLKKSAEVHKHHTYYTITRDGEIALKEVTISSFIELLEPSDLEKLATWRKHGSEEFPKLVNMGLIDKDKRITNLGKKVLETACRRKLIVCR